MKVKDLRVGQHYFWCGRRVTLLAAGVWNKSSDRFDGIVVEFPNPNNEGPPVVRSTIAGREIRYTWFEAQELERNRQRIMLEQKINYLQYERAFSHWQDEVEEAGFPRPQATSCYRVNKHELFAWCDKLGLDYSVSTDEV